MLYINKDITIRARIRSGGPRPADYAALIFIKVAPSRSRG